MSARIRDALIDLEHDVAGVRMAPARAVRARGETRRRRQAGTLVGVAAGLAVTAGIVAIPALGQDRNGSAQQVVAAPDARGPSSPGCASPWASPTWSEAEFQSRLANSRKVRVLLLGTVTKQETAAVGTALGKLGAVTRVEFVSHDVQWRRFVALYCDHPDLIAATRPENLSESYDVTLAEAGDYAAVKDAIAPLRGVEEVMRFPD
jgi:hypothetical protein